MKGARHTRGQSFELTNKQNQSSDVCSFAAFISKLQLFLYQSYQGLFVHANVKLWLESSIFLCLFFFTILQVHVFFLFFWVKSGIHPLVQTNSSTWVIRPSQTFFCRQKKGRTPNLVSDKSIPNAWPELLGQVHVWKQNKYYFLKYFKKISKIHFNYNFKPRS